MISLEKFRKLWKADLVQQTFGTWLLLSFGWLQTRQHYLFSDSDDYEELLSILTGADLLAFMTVVCRNLCLYSLLLFAHVGTRYFCKLLQITVKCKM